jgi:hypothetical protein
MITADFLGGYGDETKEWLERRLQVPTIAGGKADAAMALEEKRIHDFGPKKRCSKEHEWYTRDDRCMECNEPLSEV